MRIRVHFFLPLLLLVPSFARARSEPVLDRSPMVLNGDTALVFGAGKPGILSQRLPITGFAFGPGRDEVAFCAPAANGDTALWVVAAAFPPESAPTGKPNFHPTDEELIPYRVPTTPPRLLWTAPSGRTLRGPLWWSPDGGRIALREIDGDRGDLVSVDYVTGAATPLTRGAKVTDAAWSPDGRRIAYVSDGKTGPEVWLRTFSSRNTRRLGAGGPDLRWSTDGSTLGWLQPGASFWTRCEWDGKTTQIVAQLPARSEGASWSPNGEFCAVLAGKPKQLTIYRTAAASGETIPLPGLNPRRLLGWSPDSRLVVVVGARNQPVAVSVRKESQLRNDVKQMLVSDQRTYADLRAAIIGPPMDTESGPPSWSSAGSLVSYVWSSDKPDSIFLWGREQGRIPSARAMAAEMARRGLLPHPGQALIVVPIRSHYMSEQDVEPYLAEKDRIRAENEALTTPLKQQLLGNVTNITMALEMYLTDYDAFPDATGVEAVRKSLGAYLKNQDVWLVPGTQDVAVKYLFTPGLKASAIKDPATLPVFVIDVLPDWDLVGFADGHTKAFAKGSEWGQGNLTGQ